MGLPLWGPSVDSLLAVDVVSTWLPNPADWAIVRVDADNYPDLFWGMKVSHCYLRLSSPDDSGDPLEVTLHLKTLLCWVKM